MKKFMQTLLASGGIAAVLLAGCSTSQSVDDEAAEDAAGTTDEVTE